MKSILSTLMLFMFFTSLSGQDKFVDKRDGNEYRSITIDGVTWMAENLRFRPKTGAICFNNDTNNIPGYGVLYAWESAVKACPTGWHLPSGDEFRSLTNYYEQKETWRKIPSDPFSFGIQLGGMQDYEGTFSEMDESAYYWSSTEYDKTNAEYFSFLIIDSMQIIDISRKEDISDIHGSEKSNKYSVRCTKQQPISSLY